MRIGLPLVQPQLAGSQWPAGLQYVQNVLAALGSLDPGRVPEVIAFVPESMPAGLLFGTPPPWYSEVRLPVGGVEGREALQRAVSAHRCQLLFPLMTVPTVPPEVSMIGWIADFQHRRLPQFFSPDEYRARELGFSCLTGASVKIVCSSRAVVEDFSEAYPAARDKAALLHFRAAIDRAWLREAPLGTLERLEISPPYVYLPNQFWIHKNHRLAFNAWCHLRRLGHRIPLVCSGPTFDYRWPDHFRSLEQLVDEHDLTEDVRILGNIDRRDQVQLYRGARLVLQPSLFEGWSTTIEEARALGKPLAVSNLPVHHEQCGDAASYFECEDAEGLAALVVSLWRTLPFGYDVAAEKLALDAADERLRQFAEGVLDLWNDAAATDVRDMSAARDRRLMLPFIADLSARLEDSERDRAVRLSTTEELGRRLEDSEADRRDRLAAIEKLGQLLEESDADRRARLKVIEELGQRLESSEADRSARIRDVEALKAALTHLSTRAWVRIGRRLGFLKDV
jgi:glycosyltransferase involved in cell wall biosynthesis